MPQEETIWSVAEIKQFIDNQTLDENEWRELQIYVKTNLKACTTRRNNNAKMYIKVGRSVWFNDRSGNQITGIVEKCNSTNAWIGQCSDGNKWRCSYLYLHLLIANKY